MSDIKTELVPHEVIENQLLVALDDKSKVAKYHRKHHDNNREQFRAHDAVWYAVSRGRLKKPDVCSVCGDGGKMHAHHEDYSKRLDVVWVCEECHNNIHIKHRERCAPKRGRAHADCGD